MSSPTHEQIREEMLRYADAIVNVWTGLNTYDYEDVETVKRLLKAGADALAAQISVEDREQALEHAYSAGNLSLASFNESHQATRERLRDEAQQESATARSLLKLDGEKTL